MRALVLITAAAAGLAACAPTGGGGDPMMSRTSASQCLDTALATDFRQGGDRTIYVTDRRGPTYELRSFGNCNGLDFALSIGLRGDMGPGDRLCVGDRGHLALQDTRTQVCRVQIVRQLTPDEAARLPR
ncbi:hypothetical protein ASG17_04985 [Brevundimonas sp. Leaf363]|uniref:DUF6491 family protein n=1 Tax=Brevundimonas sp. Leaf363 TaxID=1736353 RepID=UPI0006F430CF|nr:DUF6491 family protein [Brevundimonas sp. Leaf363]KQS55444.1 hypothetical protein ASG17_04985 [Brevundimonas sp. Leaf363]